VYTLTNTLTGFGPWTVSWNDGVVQTTNGPVGSPVTLLRTVNPTNSLGVNTASNNVFYVTNVVDANSCIGNLPGDITGYVTNTINPRPTATLLSFNSLNSNEGVVYTLTNILTGIGPWTVSWNDGVVQTTNGPAGSAVTLVRTVNPTNSFGVNTASNNVFYVTSVSNADTCLGNLPGDITGVVTSTINPRPTASLLSFVSTNCNEGPVYTLTNTLTGTGPWIIYWNDGSIQANPLLTNGPVYFTRTVYPTNSFGANTASNNVYYVTNLVDANSIGNQAGDITGAVTNTINPQPTASLLSFVSTNCNEGPVYTLTNRLTGSGPWTVSWNDGVVQTTNGPAGSAVTLVRAVNPTNSFGVNTTSNNVYYVTNVVDANSCIGNLPGDITGYVTNTINPRPTASLLSFNSINSNEGPVYTLTNTLTGFGPWTVSWNDGVVQTTNALAGSAVTLLRTVNPTNSFGVNTASNNVYYVTNVVDANSCIGNLPGDITGVVTNTINPLPTASLLSFASTNCNEGLVYTLTNRLTGVGPWTVSWNDGVVQTTTAPAGSAVTLVRTVNPTNSFGVNTASNNVFYLTNIVDANSIGNLPGDITGYVTNTINPRPTASLLAFNSINSNEGPVYTLTNTLTGFGPWTVTWNDGYTQTTNGPAGSAVMLVRTVNPTNSFGVNTASNNVYYVTNVVDANSCIGNLPGDITGYVTNTINPRPTASLLSFASTNCNEGPVYTLTNRLTGVGPWTVSWNDGVVQTTNAPAGSAVTLVRTVNPTNSFGVNTASNNLYYVTNVVDANSVGNLPGDITGYVTNTINPRPTASLLAFNSINSNEGPVYTLTNTLTGFGPWTVSWNDGVVQTTNAPAGSAVTLLRTVNPTNSFGVNMASNNIYYVTNVVDAKSCIGNLPGDIIGVVTNTINPLPTASLLSFVTTNCNEGSVYTLTNLLTGVGPWTVAWNDGVVQTTNGPAGSAVTLVRTVNPTNSFGVNTASNNVYYVTNLVDANSVGNQAWDLTGVVTNTINPRPTAALLSFVTTDCNEGSVYTLTNLLTGVGPWTVSWNDGVVQTTNGPTGSPVTLVRTVNPTNSFGVNTASNNVYYVTNVVDANSCIGNLPGDLTGAVTNTINPRPTAALLSFVTTDCNEGSVYTLTNLLTGVGPWTVSWNDGVVQTTNGPAGSPVTLVRTVNPTNSFGVNTVSNNVFYVTNVVDANSCIGNLPGDITGFVTNTINPQPTATVSLIGTVDNMTNIYSSQTVTNRVVLTGIGPWILQWSDGTTANIPADKDGSVTNFYSVTLLNWTNNSPLTNYYAITSLSSAASCSVTGSGTTNTVIVWAPPALTITPTNESNVVLEWYAPAPINLEWTTNLLSSWTFVTNSTLGVTNSMTDNATNSASFYRLNTGP
jgi:hypothetical protein